MKKIISLVSVGVLSLALVAPVLADNQHDGRVRGSHAQPARFEHVRFFRGPFVQTYYYPVSLLRLLSVSGLLLRGGGSGVSVG